MFLWECIDIAQFLVIVNCYGFPEIYKNVVFSSFVDENYTDGEDTDKTI